MKKRLISLCLGLVLLLSGCEAGAGVESLLKPPKLSEEQSKIHAALTEKVGRNIKLKYPKTGDYRSAIIVANIDDEPTDEAIVFYERTEISDGNTSLRMNILDQRDGRWTSVFDHAGIGTEIDRVMISELGSSGKINIIVGYTILNQVEKTAKFYSYSDGVLNVLYQDNYSVLNILDIDSDNAKELLLITHDAVEKTGTAKLLKLEEKGFVLKSKTAMDSNGSDYKGITEGKISDGTPALFLDSARGDGSFETQIIYYSDGQLRNPLEKTREVLAMTFRPDGYFSRDIDKDGVVEIPYVYPMPGYDLAEPDKQLFLTEWRSYEKFNLERKSVGYYSLTDGYCFMLPGRWQGSVTAVEDIAGGDIVFCKYNGSLASDMPELMRISVMEKGTNEAKLQNGYQTVFSKGQYDYMVKIPEDKSEPLILTQSEIMFNFIVL